MAENCIFPPIQCVTYMWPSLRRRLSIETFLLSSVFITAKYNGMWIKVGTYIHCCLIRKYGASIFLNVAKE